MTYRSLHSYRARGCLHFGCQLASLWKDGGHGCRDHRIDRAAPAARPVPPRPAQPRTANGQGRCANSLEWSEAKIWRIETGQTSLRSLDVEAMCRIYGAPADLTEALMGLAKETKARGWWHAYGDVDPRRLRRLHRLGRGRVSISWYESELVPGPPPDRGLRPHPDQGRQPRRR